MSRSLPEMGDWDAVFDETYLQTYLPVRRPGADAGRGARRGRRSPGSSPAPRSSTARRASVDTRSSSPRRAIASRASIAPPTLLAEAERGAALRSGRGWCVATTASSRSRMRASTQSSTSSRRSATSSATRTSACSASSGACCGPAARSSWRRRTETASHASYSRPRAYVGPAPGRLPLPRGTHARLVRRNDRHVPSHHQPRGRADRAPVRPPRVLGKGVDRDAAGGRLRRHRGIRRLGRRHA